MDLDDRTHLGAGGASAPGRRLRWTASRETPGGKGRGAGRGAGRGLGGEGRGGGGNPVNRELGQREQWREERNIAIFPTCSRGFTIGRTRGSFSERCGHWPRALLPAGWPLPPLEVRFRLPLVSCCQDSGFFAVLQFEGVIEPARTSGTVSNQSLLPFTHSFRRPCCHSMGTLRDDRSHT